MEQTKTIVSDAPEFENAYKQQWMQTHPCKCMIRQTFMDNFTTSCPLYFWRKGMREKGASCTVQHASHSAVAKFSKDHKVFRHLAWDWSHLNKAPYKETCTSEPVTGEQYTLLEHYSVIILVTNIRTVCTERLCTLWKISYPLDQGGQ